MIGDIVEKEVSSDDVKPPSIPQENKPKKQSRWKKQQQQQQQQQQQKKSTPMSTSEQVHLENLQKIAAMTPEEFNREKEELLGSMDPNILNALLRRAETREYEEPLDIKDQDQKVAVEQQQEQEQEEKEDVPSNQKDGPSDSTESTTGTIHFPNGSSSKLDINDPDFESKLHDKYFPNLEVEPDKLEWMKPVTDQEQQEQYNPNQTSLSASELRFDFEGSLISPRQSVQINPYLGLHHHGDAPHAAGYTIAELAHLSRSSVASQRCIAIQTIGRILYKIGKGVYGKEICEQLLQVIEYSRIFDTLYESSDEKYTKSMNVRSYAVEALWLWKQAGGTRPAR